MTDRKAIAEKLDKWDRAMSGDVRAAIELGVENLGQTADPADLNREELNQLLNADYETAIDETSGAVEDLIEITEPEAMKEFFEGLRSDNREETGRHEKKYTT